MAPAAISSAAPQPKMEAPEAVIASCAAPAKTPRKKATPTTAAAAPSSASKPAAKSRVRKPAAKTPTGTRIRSKKLRLIAEANTKEAAANTACNNGYNDNNGNSANSANSSNSSNNKNNKNNKNNSSNIEENEGIFPAPAIPQEHIPPPRPAEEVFAKLPDDANPIDRAIFAQLALVWTEESGRWTEAMQRSLLEILPRARVTRSTASFGNQYVCRMVRQNYADSGATPTWGQFVVMRSMFGPAACFRYKWAADFAKRYPLAREEAYEGVVPGNGTLIKDILDGKAGMPVARKRREGIMQLERERTRKRIRKGSVVKSEESEAGGGLLAGLNMEAEEDGQVVQVGEDVWNEAAASAARMDLGTWLAKKRRTYAEKQAQFETLKEDLGKIRKSLDAFNQMADVVMED